jgi:hypothetical protein
LPEILVGKSIWKGIRKGICGKVVGKSVGKVVKKTSKNVYGETSAKLIFSSRTSQRLGRSARLGRQYGNGLRL